MPPFDPLRRGKVSRSRLAIRPASAQDEPRIVDLLEVAAWRHQHLDWIRPVDFLGERPFFAAFAGEAAQACLACPPEQPEFAWIRLFAATREAGLPEAWNALWPVAREDAQRLGVRQAAALSARSWMARLLGLAGFTTHEEVVFLERRGDPPPEASLPLGRIRPATAQDLSVIAHLDRMAFALPWQLTLRSLEAAFHQARLVTVVEAEGEVVAYQLTTVSPHSFHLSRLATLPKFTGRGLGRALTANAMACLHQHPGEVWSVNTQSGNLRALSLYRALGFQPTGLRYPVYLLDL